jgi:antitoxin component of MazEF toxin-antitoxin module
MNEEIIALVKPYSVGRSPESLVVVIPKEVRKKLKIKAGIKLHVKIDNYRRIIYEPVLGVGR